MDSVGKEVGGVCNQDDEAALDLGVSPDMRELQEQTCAQADQETNEQTAKEDEQKHPDTLKQAQNGELAGGGALPVLLRGLEQHDGDRIVQDTLAEDDGVQLWVDFVGIEDCQDGDRIRGRQRGSN